MLEQSEFIVGTLFPVLMSFNQVVAQVRDDANSVRRHFNAHFYGFFSCLEEDDIQLPGSKAMREMELRHYTTWTSCQCVPASLLAFRPARNLSLPSHPSAREEAANHHHSTSSQAQRSLDCRTQPQEPKRRNQQDQPTPERKPLESGLRTLSR